jgi:hypothetical protein
LFLALHRPSRWQTLYFDKLIILDPVGASRATISADQHAREFVKTVAGRGQLADGDAADILAKFADPITDAIRQDMCDREFLDLCEAHGGGRWTLSLAKMPQDLQTDQTMRHMMGDFARRAAREAGDYREHLSDEPDLIQIQEAAQESTEAPFYEVHQFNPVHVVLIIFSKSQPIFIEIID